MTAVRTRPLAPRPAGGRPRRGALWFFGVLCLAAGVVVVLYLVYSLWFTNQRTAAAQADLLRSFPVEEPAAPVVSEPAAPPAAPDDPVVAEEPEPASSPEVAEGAVAVLQFVRPGADAPVRAEPLAVVDGVTRRALERGPGRYPDASAPGGAGNLAIAGHRTTYGAPFFRLDELRDGDEIHVTDTDGTRWVYAYRRTTIVQPTALWVVGEDPLGSGRPQLTLTTCHPRFSAAERMVVFAELVGSA